MIIETQNSADDNIMHFYPEGGLNIKNSSEYIDAKSIRKSPLAENLFDIGDVVSVMLTRDCISVTKNQQADWLLLKPQILAEIMDFLTSGAPIVIESEETDNNYVTAKIKGLIETRIRPAIQKDGGDIKLCSFENGIVYVELQGKCVGCPHARQTLKEGVEKLLKTYIPEVKAVEKYEE